MFEGFKTWLEQNWIFLVLMVVLLVVVNLLYFLFSSIANRKSKKVVKQDENAKSALDDFEEEKQRYTSKIKFLTARVEELEEEVKTYKSEASEAKMNTLNLSKALDEMQGVDNTVKDEILTDDDLTDDNVTIINQPLDSEELIVDTEKIQDAVPFPEVEEPKEEVLPVVEEKQEPVKEEAQKVVNEQPASEDMPEEIIKIRELVHNNISSVTKRYNSIDNNTPKEEVEKILVDYKKAKEQLEQYKLLSSKYKK